MSAATALAAPHTPISAARHSDGRIARLVQLAALDDRDAWRELVHEFEGLLSAIARAHRLSEADSADVAQTTWLRLIQSLDRLEDPSHVGAWLATTARRECLRKLRGAPPELLEADCPEHRTPPIDERLLQAERDATLWSAFGRLPARDQALLRMLMADPQPGYEEIGAALDMPVGSIGPTRRRALARLLGELGSGEALGELVAC
ncbi:MAG: sigma-70 family RNA polymerase sigma factor [Actinobacteria bacterium]|nr:sigma-70 family RNA polymerase sigma factor [Actinomycetota bacterium]